MLTLTRQSIRECPPERRLDPKVARKIGYGIRCACGHVDHMDAFARAEVTGPLPPTDYQCPKCRKAVRRVFRAEDDFLPDGRMVEKGVTLEQIPSYL